jgi:hypothetical protein
VRQQSDWLDAIVIVAPHLLCLVEASGLSRLCQNWKQWKRIRAQISLPIRCLAILENGVTAHPFYEGITSPQTTGSPFFNVLRDCPAIQFLARHHYGLVAGP